MFCHEYRKVMLMRHASILFPNSPCLGLCTQATIAPKLIAGGFSLRKDSVAFQVNMVLFLMFVVSIKEPLKFQSMTAKALPIFLKNGTGSANKIRCRYVCIRSDTCAD